LRWVNPAVESFNSVGWLTAYLVAHPGLAVEVRFVNGVSLSPHATDGFRRDMQQRPRAVDSWNLGGALFLEVSHDRTGYSRWLLLRDRSMILWQFQGSDVLKWSARDLTTWPCYGWSCVGLRVSPDGETTE
jgi:hypothetical protein